MSEGVQWVQGLGGTLIVICADSLKDWPGAYPANKIEIDEDARPPYVPSIYDMALVSEEPISEFKVGSVSGLLLNDEPAETCYRPLASNMGMIVRKYKPGRWTETIEKVSNLPEEAWTLDGLTLEVGSAPLFLIHSGAQGRRVAEDKRGVVEFQLAPGKYMVGTAYVVGEDDVLEAIVHLLLLQKR